MDRFFEKLEVGKCVRRVNVSSLPLAYIWIEADGEKWTITTDDRLFVPSGNHLYDGEEAKEEEIDIDKVGFSFSHVLHYPFFAYIVVDISPLRAPMFTQTPCHKSFSLLFQDLLVSVERD